MRRGRPRKICSHSFGPAKSGALWVKASCPKGKTSIKVFKGKCEDCPAYSPTKVYAK